MSQLVKCDYCMRVEEPDDYWLVVTTNHSNSGRGEAFKSRFDLCSQACMGKLFAVAPLCVEPVRPPV